MPQLAERAAVRREVECGGNQYVVVTDESEPGITELLSVEMPGYCAEGGWAEALLSRAEFHGIVQLALGDRLYWYKDWLY